MKTLFYTKQHENFKIECFKNNDVDESLEDAYEIVGTNTSSGESTTLTTSVPQAAIALADNVITELQHSTRRTQSK